MRKEGIIVIASIFLVLGLFFLIFNLSGFNITGFAVYNDSSGNLSLETENESIVVTMEMALQAINESEKIILEMQKNNFSVMYINDSLIEARQIFEQARYAEILRGRGGNVTDKEMLEARQALSLVNWKVIDYGNVLEITNRIKARRDKAFLINDGVYVLNNRIGSTLKTLSPKEIESINSSFMELFERAKTAFKEERYEEAEEFLLKAREDYEANVAEKSILADLRRGVIGFIQRYWAYLLLMIIILSVLGYFAYKKFEKKILIRKIQKMKIETGVLNDLIKKTQEERYKTNKISGLVYNIHMGKYQERLGEIKEELPVLEERVKKI